MPDPQTDQELEAKLLVTDPEALSLAALAAAAAPGHRLAPVGRLAMADAYCDTPAFDLMRAGLAFRVRGAPEGVKVTLKSLDRAGFGDLVVQRLQLEGRVGEPTRPLDPAGWPEALRERVTAIVGDRIDQLAPVCVLRQQRDTYRVLPESVPVPEGVADGGDAGFGAGPADAYSPVPAPVAELSVDDVAVYAPAGPVGAGGEALVRVLAQGEPVGRLAELEIELLPGGTEEALRALAGQMAERLGLVRTEGSKLERALYLLADHPRDAAPGAEGIVPEISMAEAGRLMWRRQLVTMLLNEAGARRGQDIEYVHDMRVATRRARAVARLFGQHFKPKALAPFLKDLRRTARALGTVRDLDVALAKLRKYTKGLPVEARDSYLELAAEWRILRRQAYRELLAWLDDPEYRRFVARFAAFCDAPGLGVRAVNTAAGPAPVPTQVRHVMPSAILNRFEQVRAYEPLFALTASVPEATLHALRIDCKALRYSLEPVEHLLGPEGGDLVRQLKALQDLLGDLNDAAVARERLAAMHEGGLPPEGATDYMAYQAAQAIELAALVPEAWRTFTALENRQRLALAIAQL